MDPNLFFKIKVSSFKTNINFGPSYTNNEEITILQILWNKTNIEINVKKHVKIFVKNIDKPFNFGEACNIVKKHLEILKIDKSCEKNDEIVVTNKFFEKYCTTIVIIYMSVPTTFMSLVLSDLF